MDRYSEVPTPSSENTGAPTHARYLVIEYADLVDTIQLGVARQLDIPGACEAKSFEKTLAPFSEEEKADILCAIGQEFDEALIRFVIGCVATRKERALTILADETDGIDGYLPWQEPLRLRLAEAEARHLLTGTEVLVERTKNIERIASEFGAYACETERPSPLAQ